MRDVDDQVASAHVRLRAHELLTSGAVKITRADESGRVLALVSGNAGVYLVGRTIGGQWTCSCPASYFRLHCGHQEAVRPVT